MRRRAIAYAYAGLTILVLLLLALLAFGCLTPRQEWRHQRWDVMPEIHEQIDDAYLSGQIDEATYLEVLRWGNLYRQAVMSWGRVLMRNENPAVKQAEALRLLALVKAELEKEMGRD